MFKKKRNNVPVLELGIFVGLTGTYVGMLVSLRYMNVYFSIPIQYSIDEVYFSVKYFRNRL